MKVTVIGTGYVGLVTGTCLAQVGNHVLCIEMDADKITKLRQGIIPIHEPDLPAVVREGIAGGRLNFSTDIAAGVEHGEFLFIAVGTPPDEDVSADLRHVLTVAEAVGRHLHRPAIVINKSTVPVGRDSVRSFGCWYLPGYQLLIAFVEPYSYLHKEPTVWLVKIQNTGAWLQCDIGSLARQYGTQPQAFACALLNRALPTFWSTNLHRTTQLACSIVPGLAWLTKRDPRISAVLDDLVA